MYTPKQIAKKERHMDCLCNHSHDYQFTFSLTPKVEYLRIMFMYIIMCVCVHVCVCLCVCVHVCVRVHMWPSFQMLTKLPNDASKYFFFPTETIVGAHLENVQC